MGMSVTASDEESRGAIAQQAAEWFIANQSGPLLEEEAAAFLTWLKASPVHVREYLGIARVARHLPAAAGEPRVSLQTFLAQGADDDRSVRSLQKHVRERRPYTTQGLWSRAWPVAASLLVLAAGSLWWAHDGELLGIPKTYQTAHGEQSIERLPDGSVMRLDTDSAVTVRYSGSERLVDLKAGQALFQVAHDGTRRFRVSAGDGGAIAVGTEFNVYKKTFALEFTVVRGEIAVYAGRPSWLRDQAGIPSEVQRIPAGYQTRITPGAAVAQRVAVDVEQTLSWLQHKIAFDHRPLGEVAAEFNRYASIPVEIGDEELRALPVSGMFDAGDTESFAAFLQTLPNVRVERTLTGIRVFKTKTPT
jgi:transmembrane sensor